MGRTAQLFVAGVITIGVITALVSSDRNTASVLTAGGNAGSNLLGTAIKG